VAKIVVLGAGVVGLGTAMLLADDGHDVTVLERDAAEPSDTPQDAWAAWDRRGVNQFRLPHMFLGRYRAIVDAELPRVAQAIEDAGGLRYNPILEVPESIRGPEREGDADFEVLTGRRPVMELAVSTAAASTPRLEVRRGVAVEALLTGAGVRAGTTHVTGVRTATGELHADLVVDLMGRRSALPRLLEEAGARAPLEELDDLGFMYFARHFHSPTGALPFAFGPGLMHLGTISTLTLPADNGTWSVTLITSAKDRALLGLKDLDRWEKVVRSLPLVAHWIDGEPLEDRVATISKIEDRFRDYVVDGEPVATGVVSVGDAWACSNPSLGRGASIGMLHGTVLRDVLRDQGLDDPAGFATAFHEATDARVLPWFRWTRHQDVHRLAQIDAGVRGADYRPNDERFELEQALSSAAGKDPDLLRCITRASMVVTLLDDALADPAVVARIRELGSDWRNDPFAAPSREELVALANG
jgi:2-polyprenyl-6-methoxyphenol hydroxylase-like FAD-dependent oxidoreductase